MERLMIDAIRERLACFCRIEHPSSTEIGQYHQDVISFVVLKGIDLPTELRRVDFLPDEYFEIQERREARGPFDFRHYLKSVDFAFVGIVNYHIDCIQRLSVRTKASLDSTRNIPRSFVLTYPSGYSKDIRFRWCHPYLFLLPASLYTGGEYCILPVDLSSEAAAIIWSIDCDHYFEGCEILEKRRSDDGIHAEYVISLRSIRKLLESVRRSRP